MLRICFDLELETKSGLEKDENLKRFFLNTYMISKPFAKMSFFRSSYYCLGKNGS